MSGVGHLVLSGPLLLAVPVAAAAGAVTFISPCVLPLVPGYLSYVTGMSGSDAQRVRGANGAAGGADLGAGAGTGTAVRETAGRVTVRQTAGAVTTTPPRPVARARTVVGTALFVLGFSAVFASEGVLFGGLGSLMLSHTAGLTEALGALTIVLGLLFAGVFERFPVTGRIMRPSLRPRAGLAGAPLLGAMFGLSWSPCIGPTLAVVLSLSMSSGTALRGAILAFVYGLGLGVPFLIMAMAFQRSMTALSFARRHARGITRVGGALLVLVGILEVSGTWSSALLWMKLHWFNGYTPPL